MYLSDVISRNNVCIPFKKYNYAFQYEYDAAAFC